jgi:transposase
MNPASKSSLPVVLDPVAAAIVAQLKQEMGQAIAAKDRIIALSELKIQKLVEELRLERIKTYGKQSEKLSDLQLKLLDLEPAVSSDEVEGEIERGPLPESAESNSATDKQRRARQNHPGRNELPAHLERVDRIIPCTPDQCTCGKCGGDTKVIGYDVSEVLDRKPVEFFVTRVMREKRFSTPATKTCRWGPRPVRVASSRV